MTKKNEDVGLERFRQINKYTADLLNEQTAPPPAPEEDPATAGAPATLPADPMADPAAVDPMADPAAGEAAANAEDLPAEPDAGEVDPMADDDTTEEIDITDLVNMIKDVKRDIDDEKENPIEDQKMDDVFSKLGELESKLGEMDKVLAKIDALGAEVQSIKPPTPVEKLEMRSLDSGPFNQKPNEFFQQKQEEMKKSGKNEYVLTKADVENYGKYDMMKSFNPTAQTDF